ncbi:hypothetical protein T06_13668 [Trichinella sp. T6]|nr:hypothetical protein T06_13668 [Trichinella sp. T6]
MFPLLNIISYLEILDTNEYALSKPILENFNEQPASISDVLQLHTEKSIRNVRPILMEEHRDHEGIKWITSPLIENNDMSATKKTILSNGNLFESSS